MSSQEHLGSLRRVAKAIVFAGLAVVGSGCDSGTAPVISNVAIARARWSSAPPQNYSFEVSTLTDWGPQSPYYKVTVQNGAVVEVRDESDHVLSITASTIEQQWATILHASEDGALKVGLFTASGVPIEWLADRDEWADDAVHVWVRNFTKR
jgi:hypothetical protein